MADVLNFDAVTGVELTSAQLQGILNQIDLNVYNLMLVGKDATLPYQQFGNVGKSADHARALEALLKAREFYQNKLTALGEAPFEVFSQFDDPAF